VDSPGDNLLAEFGSVVDAVQCAVVIQTTLRAENSNLPQNRRMEFRIGINLGDVVVDGERIYGDGVNIAARMEGLAEGGGICISGIVFDQIKGKVSVSFEDLGLQQVKNIAESIRAYRAVLGSGTVSAEPQKKVEVPRQDLRETPNLYSKLMARLSPLLYKAIEDTLHRRKETFVPGGNLEFNVAVCAGGLISTVASTHPQGHSARQNVSEVGGQGLRGFFAEKQIAGYAQTSLYTNSTHRPAFDQFGKKIGEVPVRQNPQVTQKWNYYKPIFEGSRTTPWSNRFVGYLVVFASVDDADSLFKTTEFHQQVDAIASEVSPYLDAIQVLMGEEKL
jgi:hypothetical protein